MSSYQSRKFIENARLKVFHNQNEKIKNEKRHENTNARHPLFSDAAPGTSEPDPGPSLGLGYGISASCTTPTIEQIRKREDPELKRKICLTCKERKDAILEAMRLQGLGYPSEI